ncbi:Quinone oxidoreductase-like protein 2-like protein [Daphnia sinensis]|uniref:Quinone oxidoreductase-like protein 2-like protein n=1 Tax=Daphnia sinensis TaxID=1820382 RepID=A0AAD5L0Y9_9CRUS|nr:Quinone oxidoreductase-like protein 2-like protein [Daphnia sinensis]
MAAGRTLKTLSNLIARSGNVIKTASITTSNPLFSRNIKGLPYFQTTAAYRAAVLHEIAKPLVIEDVTTTTKLKDLEIRIEVYTCGVNASDILICNGQYGIEQKMPFVPGFEVCGEVKEIGPKVKNFNVGDKVIGLKKDGYSGFAEECVVLEQDLWGVPQGMTFEIGASLLDTYGTALLGLHRRAEVEADDSVLVTAAAGGLGLAAVDLAANVYKAKVIGVCGTEDKASLVRDKGAFASLKYQAKNLRSKVMEVTEGKGVSIIFDAVGGDIFNESLKCIAHEGKVIVAGFASRQIPNVPTSLLLPQSFSLIGVSLSHYRDANNEVYRQVGNDVIELYEEGLISPHVSAIFPLEEVNAAMDFLSQRKSTGKVILKIR